MEVRLLSPAPVSTSDWERSAPTERGYPQASRAFEWGSLALVFWLQIGGYLDTGQLISDLKGTNVGALAIALGFAGLIVGELLLRSRSRVAGNWMIVVASVPALTFFWVIVPAVLGLAIIVGSVTEIAGAKPHAPVAT